MEIFFLLLLDLLNGGDIMLMSFYLQIRQSFFRYFFPPLFFASLEYRSPNSAHPHLLLLVIHRIPFLQQKKTQIFTTLVNAHHQSLFYPHYVLFP